MQHPVGIGVNGPPATRALVPVLAVLPVLVRSGIAPLAQRAALRRITGGVVPVRLLDAR